MNCRHCGEPTGLVRVESATNLDWPWWRAPIPDVYDDKAGTHAYPKHYEDWRSGIWSRK
jgi:hypothetical protein